MNYIEYHWIRFMQIEPKTKLVVRLPESLRTRAKKLSSELNLNLSDTVRLAIQAELPGLEEENSKRGCNRNNKTHDH